MSLMSVADRMRVRLWVDVVNVERVGGDELFAFATFALVFGFSYADAHGTSPERPSAEADARSVKVESHSAP